MNVAKDYEPDVIADSDVEFRAEVIYFLVLDRFAEGKPAKAREDDGMYDPDHKDWHRYWGGDLQGVIDKIPYLRAFGISAVWTTPLFEQIRSMARGDVPRAPIHGYWTSDFKRINPRWMNDPSEKRLFTRDDTTFDRLIRELHGNGMKYVLDIVCNHSSPDSEDGKGKLYDDGKLVADFDDDKDHWYHHYGPTLDWTDEWQVQNGELAGLATFNENNILYRNYIKDAIRQWIGKGVDALRIDTVKHMPVWFWQEFTADMATANRNLFRFGEWIYSHPENDSSVEFANRSGMSILDFGLCVAIRECFSGADPSGFHALQRIFDLDGKYHGATELVTFFENHDMPRLQSLGVSDEGMNLALVLLLTTRGIPCLYYGCEQYLHDDTDGGDDPYNRPMMEKWENTEATRLIGILAEERKNNRAIQWGGQWPKWVDEESYVFVRRYRDSRCLVALNKGAERELNIENVEIPDGTRECILTGQPVTIKDGNISLILRPWQFVVIADRGGEVSGKTVAIVQVNDAPTCPGDRLALIGDCPELGQWDLERAYYLECINDNTWFAEVPFDDSAGVPIAYKYVIFRADGSVSPQREDRTARRRRVLEEGIVKWRDRWGF
jgi:cyclomaltodextrin glucanotransferase